jgi:peptidoglycan-N-acetylglucosamine deacetylase
MFYLAKTPNWVIKLFPKSTWRLPGGEKNIYLTFDDGPHPSITPYVLDELDKYGAKATFFCIGANVSRYPTVYADIIAREHAVGNHTQNHPNGWKTPANEYIKDVLEAKKIIRSGFFRPPYGRITGKQHRSLSEQGFQIIMWSVLSGDFDTRLSHQQCLRNVISNTGKGSIVVFHDSDKAREKLYYSLPQVLKHFTQQGYSFKRIDQ